MPIVISFVLILVTGALTSYTDLTYHKISNRTLLVIGGIALALSFALFLAKGASFTLQLFSCLIAIGIGTVMFIGKMWRGGDGKLFVVYALLMPPTGYEPILPLPCLTLFANTFICGLLALSPLLIHEALFTMPQFIPKLFSNVGLPKFLDTLIITTCLSWIFLPLFSKTVLIQYPFLLFATLYVLYANLHQFYVIIKKRHWIAFAIFGTGFIIRTIYSPSFLSLAFLIKYILSMFAISMSFWILRFLVKSVDNKHERIPFAPFFLIGCLLSYTPFLKWIMWIMRR